MKSDEDRYQKLLHDKNNEIWRLQQELSASIKDNRFSAFVVVLAFFVGMGVFGFARVIAQTIIMKGGI